MTIIGLILVLIIVGVGLHLIKDRIDSTIYTLIIVIIVIVCILLLLAAFGLIPAPNGLHWGCK